MGAEAVSRAWSRRAFHVIGPNKGARSTRPGCGPVAQISHRLAEEMTIMDIKEQDILGDTIGKHWYYRAKAAAMGQMLAGRPPRKILDVGAGSGFFSRYLLDHGADSALCVDPFYEDEHAETHHGKTIGFTRQTGPADADTVLMMDVLEHVDDDAGLLRYYAGLVPNDTQFLITVPAFQALWSGHDVFLDHKRRYTLEQLEETIRAAGLYPVLGCYYYGLTLPIAAVRRLAGRLGGNSMAAKSELQRHGWLVNSLLGAACTVERQFFKWNRIAGLSVMCLARRRDIL
jgi:hypothetical protein